MKLSKREAKYRIKIIQEYHMAKAEQGFIDSRVMAYGLSYEKVYRVLRKGYSLQWALFRAMYSTVENAMNALGKAFHYMGQTARELAPLTSHFLKIGGGS